MDEWFSQAEPSVRKRVDRVNQLGGAIALGIAGDSFFTSLCPKLMPKSKYFPLDRDNVTLALIWSVSNLWRESVDAYSYSLSQLSIIGCRGTVERSLRIVYTFTTGENLGRGTLGYVIDSCEQVGVANELLGFAREIAELGNDRSHANLERVDPIVSTIGGRLGEITFQQHVAHIINPFEEEARQAIMTTLNLLKFAFGREFFDSMLPEMNRLGELAAEIIRTTPQNLTGERDIRDLTPESIDWITEVSQMVNVLSRKALLDSNFVSNETSNKLAESRRLFATSEDVPTISMERLLNDFENLLLTLDRDPNLYPIERWIGN